MTDPERHVEDGLARLTRRSFIGGSARGIGGLALGSLLLEALGGAAAGGSRSLAWGPRGALGQLNTHAVRGLAAALRLGLPHAGARNGTVVCSPPPCEAAMRAVVTIASGSATSSTAWSESTASPALIAARIVPDAKRTHSCASCAGVAIRCVQLGRTSSLAAEQQGEQWLWRLCRAAAPHQREPHRLAAVAPIGLTSAHPFASRAGTDWVTSLPW